MKTNIYKNIQFQNQCYDDTGNHTVTIPANENYSKQQGIMHSIPELQQLIKERNEEQLPYQYNQAYKNVHRLHAFDVFEPNFEKTNEYQFFSPQQSKYHPQTGFQENITQNLEEKRPQTSLSNTSRKHNKPIQNFRQEGYLQVNTKERPNTTKNLNRLERYARCLIPQTWDSCQCPRLTQELQQKQKNFKPSFYTPSHTTYHNKAFYDYLKRYAGPQTAKFIEPKSMYNLVKKQRETMQQLYQNYSNENLQQQQNEGINKQTSPKLMNPTKKLFGNSHFFYTGRNFKRADSMKKTEYSPQNVNQLKSCLYFDERTKSIPKTTIQNKIIENIINEGSDILENQKLVDQLFKLKNQKLIKAYQQNQHHTRDGKVKFVYNDYHKMGSKGGYSRGTLGTFYTR